MNASNNCHGTGSQACDKWMVDHIVSIVSMLTLVFGSVGNVLTMLVMAADKTMKSTTRFLFFMLAAADQVALVLNEVRLWLKVTYNIEIRFINLTLSILHTLMGHFSVYMSSYLLCLISLERLCQLSYSTRKHPFKRLRHTVALVGVVAVVIVCVVLIDQFWGVYGPRSKNRALRIVIIRIFEAMSCFFLPFLITIAISLILMRNALRKSRAAASIEMSTPGRAHFRTVTKMFVGISVSQLLLGAPGMLYSVLGVLGVIRKLRLKPCMGHAIHHCLLSFMYLNNGINFFVYIFSAQGFRRIVVYQFDLIRSKVWMKVAPRPPNVSLTETQTSTCITHVSSLDSAV